MTLIKRFLITTLMTTLGLASCTLTLEQLIPPPSAIEFAPSREDNLRSHWIGKSYSELVLKHVKPITTYKSPINTSPPRSIVHYGIQSRSLNCYDAFVVVHGKRDISKPIISDYYCR